MADLLLLRELTPALPVLFTHVPKTGGSTITKGVAAALGVDQVAGISTAGADARRAFLQRCRADAKRYVYGHFRYTDAAAVYDDANFIIALRHPLERILSFYFMLLRAEPRSSLAERCLADIPGKGFAAFHERLVTGREQDNLMCRYVCGAADHRLAIETIQSRYRLVWSSDGIDAAWRKLHRVLVGEEPRKVPSKRNHAPIAETAADFAIGARPRDYREFLPPENIWLVESANREDSLLFDWFRCQ